MTFFYPNKMMPIGGLPYCHTAPQTWPPRTRLLDESTLAKLPITKNKHTSKTDGDVSTHPEKLERLDPPKWGGFFQVGNFSWASKKLHFSGASRSFFRGVSVLTLPSTTTYNMAVDLVDQVPDVFFLVHEFRILWNQDSDRNMILKIIPSTKNPREKPPKWRKKQSHSDTKSNPQEWIAWPELVIFPISWSS